MMRGLRSFRQVRILGAIVVISLVMSLLYPEQFLSVATLKAILLSLFAYAIIACGMTVLLVSGGFDLSVGSVMALGGMVAAIEMRYYAMPVAVAIGGGLLAAAACGLVNGLVIARAGVNPFITTLASMILVRGIVKIVSGGTDVSGLPDSFNAIGQATLLGVQVPILVSLALVAVGDVLLRNVRAFRANYFIGASEKAALLSGIDVRRTKIANYVLSSTLAGLAGILMTARLGNASVTAGTGVELKVITAVILGGASLSGGEGTILGSFLGCLLMAILVSAIVILPIDVYWEDAVVGAILLLAVLFDRLGARHKSSAS
jgi:ribose transport system permease protein